MASGRIDSDNAPAKRAASPKLVVTEGLNQEQSRTTDLVTERLRKKVGVRRAISVSLLRRGA